MAQQLLYCLLTHDGPKQTARLLRAIYNEHDQFIIHIDQSASAAYRGFIGEITQGLSNLRTVSSRTCAWGGFSLVQATLDMHRLGLATSANWSHAVLLSATHLPVWSLKRIRGWLPAGASKLGWHEVPPSNNPQWVKDVQTRIEWDYEEEIGVGMVRGAYLGAPEFRYYKGPQWNALARHHVIDVLGRQGDIYQRLRRSSVPDEAYFQTMVLYSQFAKECVNRWVTSDVWKPPYRNPEILNYEGYLQALTDPGSPFIRKIAEDVADEAQMAALVEAVTENALNPHLQENIEAAISRRRNF